MKTKKSGLPRSASHWAWQRSTTHHFFFFFFSREVYTKMFAAGLLPAVVGAPWPEDFVGSGGPENFDAFHSLIFIEELGRCGSGGVLWAIMGGMGIGLPPVIHFGSDYLKQKVARKCLMGEEFICLAISEPASSQAERRRPRRSFH